MSEAVIAYIDQILSQSRLLCCKVRERIHVSEVYRYELPTA